MVKSLRKTFVQNKNTSATTRGRYQGSLEGRANQFFFSGDFPPTMTKLSSFNGQRQQQIALAHLQSTVVRNEFVFEDYH